MFLTRMIYASAATEQFKPEVIDNILKTARKNNPKLHITGMLCFSNKYFLQCIESSRSNVNKLYHQILNDSRHSNIVLLDYKYISEREFGDWSMSYVPDSSLTASINLKYSEDGIFNPYNMSGESTHKMMLELRDTLHKVT